MQPTEEENETEKETTLNTEWIEPLESNSWNELRGERINYNLTNHESIYSLWPVMHENGGIAYDENTYLTQYSTINEETKTEQSNEYVDNFDSCESSTICRHRGNTNDVNLFNRSSMESILNDELEIAKEDIYFFEKKGFKGKLQDVLSSSLALKIYPWLLWMLIFLNIYFVYEIIKRRILSILHI